MTETFGFQYRQSKRQEWRREVKNSARVILDECWDSAYVDDESILPFYRNVKAQFDDQFQGLGMDTVARGVLQRFIRDKNKKLGLKISVPGNYPHSRLPPPTKGLNWIKLGKRVRTLAHSAQDIWRNQTSFSDDEVWGWFLFSAIVHGGFNDKEALNDLLRFVQTKQYLHPIGRLTACQLTVESPGYGNIERDEDNVFRSITFVPDGITKMWLCRSYQQCHHEESDRGDWWALVKSVISQVDSKLTATQLLTGASFVWEQTPNAHVPQELSRVVQGRQACCSLAAEDWANTLTRLPMLARTNILGPGLKLISFTHRVHKPEEPTRRKNPHKEFWTNLRKAIEQLPPPSKKKARNEAVQNQFEPLLKSFQKENELRLLLWTQELAASRTNLASSTISRYLSALAKPWLTVTAESDLEFEDSEGFEIIYQRCRDASTEKNGATRALVFQRFHRFQMREMGAPATVIESEDTPEICRARFVSTEFMYGVLKALQACETLGPNLKSDLRVMLILAWRTGMRIGEICRLRLKDCTGLAEMTSVVVRENKWGDIKSPNAKRRIPVEALLRESEHSDLCKIWRKRREIAENDDEPLFSPDNAGIPYNTAYLSYVFRTLSDSILVDHRYFLHSLRHTALSILSSVLCQHDEVTELFSDYDAEERHNIRSAFLGYQHSGQDHYLSLAQFAGHATPDQTFRTYIHNAYLTVGFELNKSDQCLSKVLVSNVLTVSPRFLSHQMKNNGSKKSESIALNQLTETLERLLSAWTTNWDAILSSETQAKRKKEIRRQKMLLRPTMTTEENHDAWKRIVMNSSLPGQRLSSIDMRMAYSCLHQVEQGVSTADISFSYNIPTQVLDRWVARATTLLTFTSGRDKPRIIGRDRYDPRRLILTPAPLKSTGEKRQAALLFVQAGLMYENDPARLLRFLTIYLKKVTSARSVIRFTPNQVEERNFFISTGVELLGKTDWVIRTSEKQYIGEVERLNLGFSKHQFISASYNGIGFSVIHPDATKMTQGSNKRNYSSGILRHAAHMLLITWPVGHLGIPKQLDPLILNPDERNSVRTKEKSDFIE